MKEIQIQLKKIQTRTRDSDLGDNCSVVQYIEYLKESYKKKQSVIESKENNELPLDFTKKPIISPKKLSLLKIRK